MSCNFKCGQFDDCFAPTALGNWSDNPRTSHFPGPKTYCYSGPIPPCQPFLVDDRGHFLPEVKARARKKINHWGLPNLSVWDDIFKSNTRSLEKGKGQGDCCEPTLCDLPMYFPDRSPLAFCKPPAYSSVDDYKPLFKERFNSLKERKPPVIWIFGYPQKAVERPRLNFAGKLAKDLGLIYINPERVLIMLAMRYLKFCPWNTKKNWYCTEPGETSEFFSVFADLPNSIEDCPPSIQNIVQLLEKVVENHEREAFNMRGILEVIKMLFLCFPNACGYVVDGFPITLEEGDFYEKEFWPVAAGLYFTASEWREAKRKGKNPPYVGPLLFIRDGEYLESLVEKAADEFGDICIKVLQAENMDSKDFTYIFKVLKNILCNYMSALREFKKYELCNQKLKKCTCAESELGEYDSDDDGNKQKKYKKCTCTDSAKGNKKKKQCMKKLSNSQSYKRIPPPKNEEKDGNGSDLELSILEGKNGNGSELELSILEQMTPKNYDEGYLGKEKKNRSCPIEQSKSEKSFIVNFMELQEDDNFFNPRKNILLDEERYVKEAIKKEKQSIEQDLADRQQRNGSLTYRMSVSDHSFADSISIHTLFPPEMSKPILNLSSSNISIQDTFSHDGNTNEPTLNENNQSIENNPTLLEKVKESWHTFRTYLKPTIASETNNQSPRTIKRKELHSRHRSKSYEFQSDFDEEFRYDY